MILILRNHLRYELLTVFIRIGISESKLDPAFLIESIAETKFRFIPRTVLATYNRTYILTFSRSFSNGF